MAGVRPSSRGGDGRLSRMSTSSTTSCIDRLMDITKCYHCLNQLKDARLLPCHHSFCFTCLVEMISSSYSKDEFLCPRDRQVIKVPFAGIDSFEKDSRSQELEEIIYEMEDNLLDETDTNVADIDINLESLNKGVKDIEHSSAMSQHSVNTMFEEIYKKLKNKQDELIKEIKRKSKHQILNLEYEKYRLIEAKKFQNEQFCDSSFYEEDMFDPLNTNKSITTSSPPSPNSTFSRQRNRVSTSTDNRISLLSCHIGQQQLEFSPNENTVQKLSEDLSNVGSICCDFDLKVRLDRNLLGIEEYPYGMKIGGNALDGFDWITFRPRGLSKRLVSASVIANHGKNELIMLDHNFNLKRIIPGKDRFNTVSDVTTFGNNIYVADEDGCQIVMLNSDGNVVKRFGKPGVGSLELKRPNGITSDSRGRIIVSDSLNHRVKILSTDLQKCLLTITSDKKKFKEATKFSFPCGVATDKDDNIYVTDTNNKRIVQLTREGKFMREIYPADYHDPRCVAISSDCKLLVTDRENGKLLICDSNGSSMSRISGIIDSSGEKTKFKQPYGVIVDGTDKIMLTDNELNAVFVF